MNLEPSQWTDRTGAGHRLFDKGQEVRDGRNSFTSTHYRYVSASRSVRSRLARSRLSLYQFFSVGRLCLQPLKRALSDQDIPQAMIDLSGTNKALKYFVMRLSGSKIACTEDNPETPP